MTNDVIILDLDNLANPDSTDVDFVKPSGPEYDQNAVIKLNDP